MTVGDKIRKIRTFRGMTQKELGVAIGLEEKGADNRVAQYETNYRVPCRPTKLLYRCSGVRRGLYADILLVGRG